MTIRDVMALVYPLQLVMIREFNFTGRVFESANAESFVEFIRNNCCDGFNGDWLVRNIHTEEISGASVLVFEISAGKFSC